MKKILCLLLIISLLLFAFTACKNTDDTDVTASPPEQTDTDNTPADTESVWLLSAEYRDGQLFCIHKYNPEGFISETTSFTDGVVDGRFVYEYDENGNKITDNFIDKDGKVAIENINTYDEKGNLTERLTKNEGYTERLTYTYDENGNTLQYIRESNGEIADKEIYEYDKNGNCTLMKHYFGTDGEATDTEYTYDENGNLTVEARYYDGEEKARREYTYNENGKVAEELSYENSEHVSRIVYAYDDNGNQTEWTSYFRGEQDIRVCYEYSEDGLMLKETSVNADGSVRFEVVYEYDEHGNKIKETTTYVGFDGDVSENIYEYTELFVPKKFAEKVKNQFYVENRNFY